MLRLNNVKGPYGAEQQKVSRATSGALSSEREQRVIVAPPILCCAGEDTAFFTRIPKSKGGARLLSVSQLVAYISTSLPGDFEVSKSLRTIKKSAAKSSVSRSKLRSAVKKASSAGKMSETVLAKKVSRSAKKVGAKVAKKGGGKKSTAKQLPGSPKLSKADLISAYVHQPSIIRPVSSGSWTSAPTFIGSKDR